MPVRRRHALLDRCQCGTTATGTGLLCTHACRRGGGATAAASRMLPHCSAGRMPHHMPPAAGRPALPQAVRRLALVTLPTQSSRSLPLLCRAITMHSAPTSWCRVGRRGRRWAVSYSTLASAHSRTWSGSKPRARRMARAQPASGPAPSSESRCTRSLRGSAAAGAGTQRRLCTSKAGDLKRSPRPA